MLVCILNKLLLHFTAGEIISNYFESVTRRRVQVIVARGCIPICTENNFNGICGAVIVITVSFQLVLSAVEFR